MLISIQTSHPNINLFIEIPKVIHIKTCSFQKLPVFVDSFMLDTPYISYSIMTYIITHCLIEHNLINKPNLITWHIALKAM